MILKVKLPKIFTVDYLKPQLFHVAVINANLLKTPLELGVQWGRQVVLNIGFYSVITSAGGDEFTEGPVQPLLAQVITRKL